ncbi:prenyltransferase/squalene oxidase repeat-containing protein [Planctomycetota bacterium]
MRVKHYLIVLLIFNLLAIPVMVVALSSDCSISFDNIPRQADSFSKANELSACQSKSDELASDGSVTEEAVLVSKKTDENNTIDNNLAATENDDINQSDTIPPASTAVKRIIYHGDPDCEEDDSYSGRSSGSNEKRVPYQIRYCSCMHNYTPAIENGTQRGLSWLKQHQSTDGSWSANDYTAHCDFEYGCLCGAHGYASESDTALTGLALLAFLGAGYTHDDGSEFAVTIRKGLKYLKNLQDDRGWFMTEKYWAGAMRGQAIGTLAMCEAYGLTENNLIKEIAQKGINAILETQNWHPKIFDKKYGWGSYYLDNYSNTDNTGWMVMALKSAKSMDLVVPEDALEGALLYFEDITDPIYLRAGIQSRGGYSDMPGYNPYRFRFTESATAVGIVSRVFCGQKITNPAIRGGITHLTKDLPEWNERAGSVDYNYWYFGTLATFQVGGGSWKAWNKTLKDAVVERQRTREDGCAWGSWDPQPAKWGERGGRVYATAINLLIMEIYYRYDKVFN